MEELNPKGDESVLLEFSMRQRLFVCFHVLFWQGRSKSSPLLISDGCWEQRGGGTAGLLPEDAGDDCVWPPSGDAKEFVWRGGLDLPREYITGVSSTSEL